MGYVGNQTTNAYTSITKQDITGNGGTAYTLDHAVANANEIEVFVNNVRQEPAVAYTVSGTSLTMTGNVAASDDFYVVFQGKAVGTVVPPDDSVTTARINDDAVTSAKIADDAVVSATIADDAVKFAHINEDFYKTGTWTPTLKARTTDFSSVTYASSTYGYYDVVGDTVFIYGRIRTSAVTKGSAAGGISIEGLPFTVDTIGYSSISIGYTTGWSGYAPSVGLILGNTTRIDLYRHASTNASSSQGADLVVSHISTTTNDIIFSGIYRKA